VKVPAQKARPSVVLADDHRAFVGACESLLAREFDIVATVHGGRDALEAVETHDPDVLVLDISMPDMTGVEVMEILRSRNTRARIVVLTVNTDAALADRVIALGAHGYVVKARMVRDLTAAIHAALAGERFRSPINS